MLLFSNATWAQDSKGMSAKGRLHSVLSSTPHIRFACSAYLTDTAHSLFHHIDNTFFPGEKQGELTHLRDSILVLLMLAMSWAYDLGAIVCFLSLGTISLSALLQSLRFAGSCFHLLWLYQRKSFSRGQQLKGKILLALFHTFWQFSTHFHNFQSFSEFFLQDFFLELRRFTTVLVQGDEKIIKENQRE